MLIGHVSSGPGWWGPEMGRALRRGRWVDKGLIWKASLSEVSCKGGLFGHRRDVDAGKNRGGRLFPIGLHLHIFDVQPTAMPYGLLMQPCAPSPSLCCRCRSAALCRRCRSPLRPLC
jgi:hypothetical protein